MIAILIATTIVGCTSLGSQPEKYPVVSTPPSPTDKESSINTALENRNLRRSSGGDIVHMGPFECNGWEMEMHRGHPDYPENSLASIYHAALTGAPVIEIDITLLTYGNEGLWILHHDDRTGRAIAHPTQPSKPLRYLKPSDIGYYRHRDPQSGQLTNSRPPTLSEALALFSKIAKPGQALNIEVKGGNHRAIQSMDSMVRRYLKPGQYRYSSSSLNKLKAIREVNSTVYLGMVQMPHPNSMAQLRKDLNGAASDDPLYQRYKGWLDIALNTNRRKIYLNARGARYLQAQLGGAIGIHADIRDLVLNPNDTRSVQRLGLRVASYSINGQDYHESRINMALARSVKADAAIVDETPYGFCNQWSPLRRNGVLRTKDRTAIRYDKLPLDTDFRDMETLHMLEKEGLYPSLGGDIKSLARGESSATKSASSKQTSSGNLDIRLELPKRAREEAFDLSVDGPLIIRKETFEQ